jgi:hypothetical protein
MGRDVLLAVWTQRPSNGVISRSLGGGMTPRRWTPTCVPWRTSWAAALAAGAAVGRHVRTQVRAILEAAEASAADHVAHVE